MKVKRLKRLVKVLQTLPDENFDLRSWISEEDSIGLPKQALLECGTTCCVIGWACQFNWFKDRGLHLSTSGYPTYKGHNTSHAIAEFLQIPHGDVRELFYNGGYAPNYRPSKELVIAKLEQYIEIYSPE